MIRDAPDRGLITSASIGLSPAERAAQPLASGLLAFEPGVRGLPEARFRG
ncbi:MAG TPA: hypothetical protein VJX92_14470 [Methylomirabilota bacterium]|nr:hypothetical protein [Methylomirabilota bacterium]